MSRLICAFALAVTACFALPPLSAASPADAPPGVGSAASTDGAWLQFHGGVARTYHVAFHDRVRDRLLIFGGSDGAGIISNEIWELPRTGNPRWKKVHAIGVTPAPRTQSTAVFDSIGNRLIVFGGSVSGSSRNDVWQLALSDPPVWSQLVAAGSPPSPLYAPSAVMDDARRRMIVFGGHSGGGVYRSDTWSLSLDADPVWTQIATSGRIPPGRREHTAVFDAPNDRMIVHGGTGNGLIAGSVWVLNFAAGAVWDTLAVPFAAPPRSRHTAVIDPIGRRMIVFGGVGTDGNARNDALALSLDGSPSWTGIGVPPKPQARAYHVAAYDPLRQELEIHGGGSSLGTASILNDTWVLPLSIPNASWAPIRAAGPSARAHHTGIFDPVRDRMLVFGGFDGGYSSELWSLRFGDPSEWELLIPQGTPPSGRAFHTAIYDPLRDRMLVFGGWDGAYRNDLWQLTLTDPPVWSQLSLPGSGPSPRIDHSAIYDPVREQMIVYGGRDAFFTFSDLHTLSLGESQTWGLMTPLGTPSSALRDHVAVFDPTADAMVVVSGITYPWSTVELLLSGGPSWEVIVPSVPQNRYRASGILDTRLSRLILFGGNSSNGYPFLNSTSSLSLNPVTPAWVELNPVGGRPAMREGHAAIYDPVRDRMVIFGGTGFLPLGDTWILSWGGGTLEVEPGTRSLRQAFDLSVAPNPVRESATMSFRLDRRDRARIDVFDISGHRVARLADGEFPGGMNRVTWSGTSDDGRRAPPGAYWARIETGGRVGSRRFVRVF